MSAQPLPRDTATVAQLSQFDALIDVRTPSEFALDHIPYASNLPVLSDAERAQVGTLYKQVSPFTARKVGAALVSANIARHLQGALQDKPRQWRPLLYCWRGGQRSASITYVLREIGWDARQLEGGYKAFRRAVLADTPALVQCLHFRVVCGLTGCGKTRLLQRLQARGAQVLDLEALAAHRGSVLGGLPERPQPSQKMFESLLWDRLRRLDAQRVVYVESESRKIGRLQLPQILMDCMWRSPCVRIETSTAARVALLREEYVHFFSDRAGLQRQLDCLVPLHGHQVVESWKQMAERSEWDVLVTELLTRHYDPAYRCSIVSHYPHLPQARVIEIDHAGNEAYAQAAEALLDDVTAPMG
ncbi:MAG: tRNA 2-selenouridine(34) synthase MnmH [Burkholderiales bacterium]|nr:tRNA 2-selenouridine(34) synthase MnmH [Burkholderiales bacterium]